MKPLGSIAFKVIVVRKCLQPRGLPWAQAATLGCIRMNEVVSILANMGGDRRSWPIPKLHSKTISECESSLLLTGALVLWKEDIGKVSKSRRFRSRYGEGRCKQIP